MRELLEASCCNATFFRRLTYHAALARTKLRYYNATPIGTRSVTYRVDPPYKPPAEKRPLRLHNHHG